MNRSGPITNRPISSGPLIFNIEDYCKVKRPDMSASADLPAKMPPAVPLRFAWMLNLITRL